VFFIYDFMKIHSVGYAFTVELVKKMTVHLFLTHFGFFRSEESGENF